MSHPNYKSLRDGQPAHVKTLSASPTCLAKQQSIPYSKLHASTSHLAAAIQPKCDCPPVCFQALHLCHLGHRWSQQLQACLAQLLHSHLLGEGVQRDAAVHACVAVGGEHMVGSAGVVTHALWGPSAHEDAACRGGHAPSDMVQWWVQKRKGQQREQRHPTRMEGRCAACSRPEAPNMHGSLKNTTPTKESKMGTDHTVPQQNQQLYPHLH